MRLEVLDPVSMTESDAVPSVRPAEREADLDGKRIGLYWNIKAGGDVALRQVREHLERAYPDSKVQSYVGDQGAGMRFLSSGYADSISEEVDVVVAATGDCGACTSWIIHDAAEFEKRAVPTVAVVSRGFLGDARSSAQIFGVPDVQIAVIEEAVTNQPDDAIRGLIDASIDQIIDGLTEPVAAPSTDGTNGARPAVISIEGTDWPSTVATMNHRFIENGWGDGLPLLPPTPARVEDMLAGTKLAPDEVIATMDPGRGKATVEKIAVNAVMAGCEPEQLPILIAAVRCSNDPKAYWRQTSMSTSPTAPMIVVNGPIAKELGINSGADCMGPGAASRVNVVIGRAFHLIMMNLGHAWPGSGDMDTQGTPIKLGLCIAENEEASPWDPYHVELGYPEDTSLVTIKWVWPGSDFHGEAVTSAEEMLKQVAYAAVTPGVFAVGMWLQGRNVDPYSGQELRVTNMTVLSPDAANFLARQGYQKEEIREYLWTHARLPFGDVQPARGSIDAFRDAHPNLVWLLDHPETEVPVVEAADCFEVVVAGGENMNARGQYFYGLEESLHAVVED